MSDEKTKVQSLNMVHGIIGEPGCGKTQEATAALLDHRGTCYRLAVDPNGDLPPVLHTGRRTGVVVHKNMVSLERAIANDPRGIHALWDCDATPVIKFAAKLTQATWEKRGEDTYGIPVVVLVDEMSLWDDASYHKAVGPTLKWLLTQRRHAHLALIYGTQSARLCHYMTYDRSTELQMFRIENEDDRAKLRKGGVNAYTLDRVAQLPQYKSITYRRGMFTGGPVRGQTRMEFHANGREPGEEG